MLVHLKVYNFTIVDMPNKFKETTCLECGEIIASGNGLSWHLKKCHNTTLMEYSIKWKHNGEHPCCKNCNTKLQFLKSVEKPFAEFCSRKCSSAKEFNGMTNLKGEQSPNFGKIRSQQTKQLQSQNAIERWEIKGDIYREMMSSDEYRNNMSNILLDSYKENPERKDKISQSLNDFWNSDSEKTRIARQNASLHATSLIERGIVGSAYPYKSERKYNPFTLKEEFMHSSWETSFLDYCIQENIPVTKEHNIRIPYQDEQKHDHIYIPDFIGLKQKFIVEIKGRMSDVDKIKIKNLRQWAKENSYEVIIIEYNIIETAHKSDAINFKNKVMKR